jgi:hypothetical protein
MSKTIARRLATRELLEADAIIIEKTPDTMTLQYEDGSIIRLKITARTPDGTGVEVEEVPLS